MIYNLSIAVQTFLWVYIDIAFSRRNIAADVCVMVY